MKLYPREIFLNLMLLKCLILLTRHNNCYFIWVGAIYQKNITSSLKVDEEEEEYYDDNNIAHLQACMYLLLNMFID